MESQSIIDLRTKYNEKYQFKVVREFLDFAKLQYQQWLKIEDDYGAKHHLTTNTLQQPWAEIIRLSDELSHDQKNSSKEELDKHQKLRQFVDRINEIVSNGAILFYDSFEGQQIRKHQEANPEFFDRLCRLMSLSSAEEQFNKIDYGNAIDRKLYQLILECKVSATIQNHIEQLDIAVAEEHTRREEILDFNIQKFTKLTDDLESKSDELFDAKKLHQEYMDESYKDLDRLKSAYEEKIAIAQPIEYWKSRRKTYLYRSVCWGVTTLVVGIFFLSGVWYALSEMPDISTVTDIKNQIKITILFITGIGIMSYLLNILGRLFLSSVHLLSDIDERTNLTHFYLSLIEGGKVDEKQREIILQSLFSRTDSGIIKGGGDVSFPINFEALKSLFNK